MPPFPRRRFRRPNFLPAKRGAAPPRCAALLRATPWPSLRELTDCYIDDVLRRHGGRIGGTDGAAAMLGVHPNTLRIRRQRKKGETKV